MEIREILVERATEYCGAYEELKGKEIPSLLADFVIEKYRQQRNYPSSFNDEKIEKDMKDHLSTLAMAVVDLFLKMGNEGTTSYSESGIKTAYENAYISLSLFNDVLPFVKSIK